MREIKFRAYYGKDGGFEYFDLTNSPIEKLRKYYIMQYTGLKDKNGKEIYEGDILEHKSNFSDKSDFAKVYWDKNTAGFDWTAKDIALNFVESATKRFEVIGNIYENPELIIKK